MATQQQELGHQEGSRWINRRPEPGELAQWFERNVSVHEGLSHASYLPGITLIPNKERVERARLGERGETIIAKVEQLVYVPYPKVETRVKYFWDLMAARDWLGVIEQIPAPPNRHLPAGFFSMPVTGADGRHVTPYIGVSYQVRIFARDLRAGGRGRPVVEPPAGTKIVPLLKSGYNGLITPDENAIHKAQTGAIGRALGYAGMLIVPGAGIATAEDMLEFLSLSAEPGLPVLPAPSEVADATSAARPPDNLAELVGDLRGRLEAAHPATYEEARAWCHEKGYDIADPPAEALRGLERQLRRKLAAAEKPTAAPAQATLPAA